MREITTQSTNKVNIIGKLLSTTIREGKTGEGKVYNSGNMILRVNQGYFGIEEQSEISVSFFATALTSKGTVNPAFENIQKLREFKSAQNVGFESADTIKITGASLSENMFIAKGSNQLVDSWNIRASFFNEGSGDDVATFCVDAYIMDQSPELDKEGNETGRVIVKGGVVQYNGVLDVIEFIAEDPIAVDHVSRNWDVDSTVQIRGRIRAITKEENRSRVEESSWGEAIPEPSSTKIVRELIITSGSDEAFDEETAYDPVQIKKAFSERKARIEQLRMDAQGKAAKAAPAKKSAYNWEE